MSLVFYTNPRSRGRIVRWMLEEVGAPYETALLDFASGPKSAEFLAINPMGKIPAIVHDGHVVTEAAAICAYLADAFPDAGLAPPPTDRADYYRWLFFAAGPVEQAVIDHARKIEVTPEQRGMVGYGSYDTTVDTLEGAVRGKAFVAGKRFSAADVYVGSHIAWGLAFGTLPKREPFETYLAGLTARPAYLRAAEIDERAAA